jgi:NADH-quinone oxidoreductase subunit J
MVIRICVYLLLGKWLLKMRTFEKNKMPQNIFCSGRAFGCSDKVFYYFVLLLFLPFLIIFFCLPIFYKITFLTLLSAFLSLTIYSTIYALIMLVVTYIFASMCFFIIGLDFLALSLIFIYVGAIVVLFVFVVMTLLPEKIDKIQKITFFEKICLFIFISAIALLFSLVIYYDFGQTLFLHWFELYKKTGLFISDYGKTEVLTDIGLTLYGQQSFLFILIVLLLFLGFLCPILLTLDEDAEDRVPIFYSLYFPINGEFKYFIYLFLFITCFGVYFLFFNAQSDTLNNVEYYNLIKLSLTPLTLVLNNFFDSDLYSLSVIELVYSDYNTDLILVNLLEQTRVQRKLLSSEEYAYLIHDMWQNFIRLKISSQLTSLITEIIYTNLYLDVYLMFITESSSFTQKPSHVQALIARDFLEKRLYFDVILTDLIFFSSLFADPHQAYSYDYLSLRLSEFEYYEYKDKLMELTNNNLSIIAQLLNDRTHKLLWFRDFDFMTPNGMISIFSHPIESSSVILTLVQKNVRVSIFEKLYLKFKISYYFFFTSLSSILPIVLIILMSNWFQI